MPSTATQLGTFTLDGGIDPISVNATGYEALVVGFFFDDTGNKDWVTTCSLNGTDMGAAVATNENVDANVRVWRMNAPAQTTANVVVARSSGTGSLSAGRVTVLGINDCNTSEAVGTPAYADSSGPNNDSASATATDAAADLWLAFLCLNGTGATITDNASQTSIQKGDVTSAATALSSKASADMGYTWTASIANGAIAVLPIKSAGGAAVHPGGARRLLLGVG